MPNSFSSSPLVSIVIPTYNRAFCIDRAVSSVINQNLTDWELIIVDNNSTDNTVEIINNFSDRRISITQIDNKGIVASSRNLGIKLARGTFVAFLDSDDWWVPQKLEIAVSALQDGSDIVYHDLYKITKLPVAVKGYKLVRTRELPPPVFVDLLCNGNAINNSSVVVRTNLIRKINGFSEKSELVGSEDFDGWIRLAKLTDKFTKLKPTLGFYWSGDGNLTSPTSVISNNLCLRNRYEDEFRKILGENLPGWMLYALARASLTLSDFPKARKYSLLALKAKLPKLILLKAAITLIMSVIRLRG